MILLIDNYDSFSYNLYQLIGQFCQDIKVVRNDQITLADIEQDSPDAIVLSPGPGRPKDAGICENVIRHFRGRVPILGICLGHQAICETLGGSIVYAPTLMHGKKSSIALDTHCPLFYGLSPTQEVARYHSLIADPKSLPVELHIIARTEANEIMGVANEQEHLYGLQFHPESILTECGVEIINNFITIAQEQKN